MDEFTLINQYFKRKTTRNDVGLSIGDDCALLKAPQDAWIATTIDSMVLNTHFTETTPPAALGYKSLAMSLSDLAAMAATPAWALLSLTMPEVDTTWLSEFSQSFFELLDKFDIALVGGNTTRGPLSISTQLTGFVPYGKELTRAGAKPDQDIYVTGILGEAALALDEQLNKKVVGIELETRLYYPPIRIHLAQALRGLATAAIDISDGLTADLTHILQASNTGALIFLDQFHISKFLQNCDPQDRWRLMLQTGEDYELCFTADAQNRSVIEHILRQHQCPYQRIGVIEKQLGLRAVDSTGRAVHLTSKGFTHF
jgi:thiamine-monophosphate kinase